ncbi:hypothetical protein MTO96_027473 [Rhipicephalus appendiculatus]
MRRFEHFLSAPTSCCCTAIGASHQANVTPRPYSFLARPPLNCMRSFRPPRSGRCAGGSHVTVRSGLLPSVPLSSLNLPTRFLAARLAAQRAPSFRRAPPDSPSTLTACVFLVVLLHHQSGLLCRESVFGTGERRSAASVDIYRRPLPTPLLVRVLTRRRTFFGCCVVPELGDKAFRGGNPPLPTAAAGLGGGRGPPLPVFFCVATAHHHLRMSGGSLPRGHVSSATVRSAVPPPSSSSTEFCSSITAVTCRGLCLWRRKKRLPPRITLG